MEYRFKMADNEYWWGGCSNFGTDMPYSAEKNISVNLKSEKFRNQTMPLFVSNKGRYIWSDNLFDCRFENGEIIINGEDVVLCCGGSTLRDAYQAAMKEHFPFDGKKLPEEFFTRAQYNGWMQFMYEPTQQGVLDYAKGIVDNGFEPGILIIDEGWQKDYGQWTFDSIKFPNPKEMVDQLHDLGFKVMLWIVPYVTGAGQNFANLSYANGECPDVFMRLEGVEDNWWSYAIVRWWNGFSPILDFTKESDCNYLKNQLDALVDEYGIDGFKFDGGSVSSYNSVVNGTPSLKSDSVERNDAWNEFGRQYKYHEYKDSYKQGGKNMIARLTDRAHSWDNGEGIDVVLPFSLVQGLIGTPFICPDMIGGGEWSQFYFECKGKADQELFVRMAQCSAMFPMMQFSLAPWQYLDKEHLQMCLDAARLHKGMSGYILELVNDSFTSGEPIVKHPEYEFPGEGFEKCSDCFMLGYKYFVAPVITKGSVTRDVKLPSGLWKYCDGTVYEGSKTITVDAPLNVLPYFERL